MRLSSFGARRPRIGVRSAAIFGAVLLAAQPLGAVAATPAPPPEVSSSEPAAPDGLVRDKLTIKSVIGLDLRRDFARMPLHQATVAGESVWFVLTDVSDEDLAESMGLNFAPRLSNLITPECPLCVMTVASPEELGSTVPEFVGKPDFSPTRVLVPGPDGGFPPLRADPGAIAGPGYSPYVNIAGTDIVFNAPVVAVGDGPFDVITHVNTHDRALAVDTDAMTADLGFIRAFSNGEDIFYLNFDASSPLTATIERSTFSPGLGLSPAPDVNRSRHTASAAIFSAANGQLGRTSPPAQGLDHVIIDGLNAEELHLGNRDLLEALRAGGDAHNVLDVFPTLESRRLRLLYSPDWDLHLGVWTDEAVAAGENYARPDANVIRQAALDGLITSPGGKKLRSDRNVINCPALGWETVAPKEPVIPKPPHIP